ncbi:hypothetical protein E3N88_12405 [Mikania micrantha]|uniref:Squalene monooxygenase n=1 Tax=Mikania micrantha TaxID=192012 RepID=A0A5N6P8E4_9ASTR|nr:hypothetical protein E3N88_12405 [Mikania micrantha]
MLHHLSDVSLSSSSRHVSHTRNYISTVTVSGNRSINHQPKSPPAVTRLFSSTNVPTSEKTIMQKTIDNSYIVGSFFVSLIGFVVLSVLRRRTISHSRKIVYSSNNAFKNRSDSTCGELDRRYGSADADVIIVGAGVTGAALAHTLGKEGCKIRVIERDLTEPDRIVGELLQPGGYLKLIELGLEDCVEEIDAQRVLGYALFKDGKSTKLSYPLEKFHSDVSGLGFHNGRFIQKMRDKVATLPNVELEQGTVTSLLEDEGMIKGVQYKTISGDVMKAFAPLTVVCDGCFSNLRRSLCKPQLLEPRRCLFIRTCEPTLWAKPKPIWVSSSFLCSSCLWLWSSSATSTDTQAIMDRYQVNSTEGVRQMFFPASVPAYHRAPPKKGSK